MCAPNLRADTWVRPYRREITCMIAVWYYPIGADVINVRLIVTRVAD